MSYSSLISLKIKAKLLQKAKKKQGQSIALKEAYSILAKAAGYPSWKELKDSLEKSDILNPPHWSAQWKIWFSTKKEAADYLKTSGGYLIPYQKQFFVCDSNYINALGISEDDPDLYKVGRDWSLPKDKEAWEKLLQKIIESHKCK